MLTSIIGPQDFHLLPLLIFHHSFSLLNLSFSLCG